MLVRRCAGGVVFHKDRVFILQNDKQEWVLPKGVIRNNFSPSEVALQRVREETGIRASIADMGGETSYEFYSYSRQKPVCNQITWFVMVAETQDFKIAQHEGFQNGGFFPLEEALEKITYSQDRSLVLVSYRKIKNLEAMGA